jgi:hypothetical protein
LPDRRPGPTQIGWHVAAGETQLQTAELNVGNSGSGDLQFTAQSSAAWLTLSSAGGTAPATLILTGNPAGFTEGTTGNTTVTLTAVGFPDQGITVPVTLAAGNTFVVGETPPVPACGNGLDDDADGFADLDDPGCIGASDVSEREPTLPCDDGLDNDADGLSDYPNDPGCPALYATPENPPCDDGIDNNGDGLFDLDDPNCSASWPYWEVSPCGLGAELAPVLAGLHLLRRRRAATRSAR